MNMAIHKFLIEQQVIDWRFGLDVDHRRVWVPVGAITIGIKGLVISQIAEELK